MEIAAIAQQHPSSSPLQEGPILAKLKVNTSEFIRVDSDAILQASMRFQYALYWKFFGKPPSFEHSKTILQTKCSNFGVIHISNLPNGFLLLRCETHDVILKLLFEEPWAINGMVLQLSPWQPCFIEAFTKLTIMAIWLQLQNLLVDF